MSIINRGTGAQSPEPFRMCAETYWDMGLSVIPCLKEGGKKPCVTWKRFQTKRIGGRGLGSWLAAFPAANIAIVTGELSAVTVVDCDNPNVTLMFLLDKFGETPLVVQTPSGGYHLYYRYNGEHNSQDASNKIDIKGQGGFVVAPPSYNRITGEVYHFVEGDLSDFHRLPDMKKYNEIQRGYNEGERNNGLFKYLLKEAQNCNDINMLEVLAEAFNQQHVTPPLDSKAIQRTVASVWKYRLDGRLFVGGKQFIKLDMDKIADLRFIHSRAMDMYIDLVSCHWGKNESFAISPEGYSKRCKWSENTIRQEIQTLIRHGLLKLVYKGGHSQHNPSLYKLI